MSPLLTVLTSCCRQRNPRRAIHKHARQPSHPHLVHAPSFPDGGPKSSAGLTMSTTKRARRVTWSVRSRMTRVRKMRRSSRCSRTSTRLTTPSPPRARRTGTAIRRRSSWRCRQDNAAAMMRKDIARRLRRRRRRGNFAVRATKRRSYTG